MPSPAGVAVMAVIRMSLPFGRSSNRCSDGQRDLGHVPAVGNYLIRMSSLDSDLVDGQDLDFLGDLDVGLHVPPCVLRISSRRLKRFHPFPAIIIYPAMDQEPGLDMTASLIEGKPVADQIRKDLMDRIAELKDKGVIPGLAVILVGDDAASPSYVRMKGKACEDLGMYSQTVRKPADLPEEELLQLIDELNADPQVHGILVQLPLPPHIDVSKVIAGHRPGQGRGRLPSVQRGQDAHRRGRRFPAGHAVRHPGDALALRQRHCGKARGHRGPQQHRGQADGGHADAEGKGANATVTVCHSRTEDLKAIHPRPTY